MTTRSQFIRHIVNGGWATDLGTRISTPVSDGGVLAFPFLLTADNIEYTLGGGYRKIGGAAKLNSSAFESGADIMGIFDFWLQGTGGSPTQHRIVHVGTVVKKDDGDNSWSDLKTGLEAGKVPDYSQLDDLLIFTSDSTTDVPQSWDGTTQQNLAGSPPNFAFSVVHEGRVFAAGDAANPSKVYYSGFLQPTNWTAGGSGEFNIDPQDGDRVTGLASTKEGLWVFKGPYKGSIHRIQGTAPTGADGFRKNVFIRGLGCVAHRTIVPFRDDMSFMWSDGSIHSLKAVQQFGKFARATLTFPISTWIDENVRFSALNTAWGADYLRGGFVVFGVPTGSSTVPNMLIALDYRFDPPRWKRLNAFANHAISGAMIVDGSDNNRRVFMTGGTDGFVRKMFQSSRNIDTTGAIAMAAHYPFADYGIPHIRKTIVALSAGIETATATSVSVGFERDDAGLQTKDITLTPSGEVLGVFFLGVDSLGSSRHIDEYVDVEEGGEFRAIGLRITNSVLNEEVKVNDFGALYDTGDFGTD